MAFMNARKRNKTLTYVIVAFVSAGLLLSVSMYWAGGSSVSGSGSYTPQTGSATQAQAVKDFNDGTNLMQSQKTQEANKKFASAIKGFEEVLKTEPENLPVLGDLATAYFYSGNADKAIETANKALTVDPNYTIVRLNLARYLFYGKNDSIEAVKQLKMVSEKDTFYKDAQQLITQFEQSTSLPPAGNSLPPKGNSLPPKGQGGTLPPKN